MLSTINLQTVNTYPPQFSIRPIKQSKYVWTAS